MSTRDLVLSCKSKSKILKWHVQQGETVKTGKVLATYIFTEKVDPANFIVQNKLKAKFNGKIIELIVKPNDEVSKGNIVARVQEEECEHNTVIKDMCCVCGADLRKEPGVPGELAVRSNASEPVVHNIHELKVSPKEAERLAKQDEKQLLKCRKLVLVVDLDMTLIHTTVQPMPKNAEDIYSFTLPGHQYEYHTKLRPDARKFLENISKFYELHIFTMGSRMYAHTIAKMLDPDGKHFAHRIRSRDEFINSFSKFHDLKALFPCGDHMVCIIDDREDVWNFAPNLIMVKPYKYFKGAEDVNDPFKENGATPPKPEINTNGTMTEIKEESNETKTESNENPEENDLVIDEDESTSESKNEIDSGDGISASKEKTEEKASDTKRMTAENNKDEAAKTHTQPATTATNTINNNNTLHKDTDDYLYFLGKILERIHQSFYATLDDVKERGDVAIKDSHITKYCSFGTVNPDVRVIAPELRRQSLRGCNLVFTGVVPTNIPLEKSKPWRAAVGLGARVTADIIQQKNPTDVDLFTTHVVAARHGTQKSYKASRTPHISLVNPNWLWCASERWEWPEESIFPLPDGKNSPGHSLQGTPQHNPFEQQKVRKQVSPLAQEGFELPGGYDPDAFLESVNPLGTFSRGELDAMDKEVEELMHSENDDSSDDEAPVISVNSIDGSSSSTDSKKRKRNASGSSSSSEDDKEKTSSNSSKKIRKEKRKSKKTKMDDGNDSKNESSTSGSSSSSSSSDNSGDEKNKSGDSSSSDSSDSSSESDDEAGTMLERRISESSENHSNEKTKSN